MPARVVPEVDFVVVGAGVVGSAIARELAGSRLTVALVDARRDVCEGTSKANTALCCTGFDATPGTLESRLVARGYHLAQEYCERAGIEIRRTGAVLVAWDADQAADLPGWHERAVQNGYLETRLLTPDEVYELVPDLGPGVAGGLDVPGESVMDPWSFPLALATEAVQRGARLELGRRVTDVTVEGDTTVVETDQGPIRTRWVVNAAGIGGDMIDAMLGHHRFTYHPRRGEFLVFDKLASARFDKIVLAVPSKAGKGVLVSPTVFGNVMVGPTAEDREDRTDTSTSEGGLASLVERGRRIVPGLVDEEVTAAYAGLRAASDLTDFLIEVDEAQRYVVAAGIRSTGLTAALAVAEHVRALLEDVGVDLSEREGLPPTPRMPPLGEGLMRPFQDTGLIAADPLYGTVVCFCERVTEGEIRDATRSTIPAEDIGGLRRRTRAMNGRCQGFFCGAQVECLFEKYRDEAVTVPPTDGSAAR